MEENIENTENTDSPNDISSKGLKPTVIEGGHLYVIGTPIGNLSDISKRAIETLSKVSFVAAEDTRVTGLLLSRIGVKNRLISCREHNIISKSKEIIARLKKGESCGVVTDAGMPCISDPGEVLVKLCHEAGVEVHSVPSASAFTAGLSISGISSERFCFEGFLPPKKSDRIKQLITIKDLTHTLIFYEAPHKLIKTLYDLISVLGDRGGCLCREITKMHEQVMRGRLSEIISFYDDKSPRGEYVIIVEGTPPKKREKVDKYAHFKNKKTMQEMQGGN